MYRQKLDLISKKIGRSKLYVHWHAHQYVISGLCPDLDAALDYMLSI